MSGKPPPLAPLDRYVIHIHRPNLRRFVWRRWWATATCGIMMMGDAGGGVWRARTREKLIAKTERSLRRHALGQGFRHPTIVIDEELP